MQRVLLFWALSLAILMGGAGIVCLSGQCVATPLDRAGLSLANAMRSDRLDFWAAVITWFGSLALLLPLTALVAGILLRCGHRLEAGFVMLSLLTAAILSHLAKLVLMRPRPDLFPLWTVMPADWSYPSAHAMQVTAVAVAIILVAKRPRVLGMLALAMIVLLVSLSRIYLQVHFPSDVLAGVLVSALWVMGLHALIFDRSSKHSS